jgi:hypothetical protein
MLPASKVCQEMKSSYDLPVIASDSAAIQVLHLVYAKATKVLCWHWIATRHAMLAVAMTMFAAAPTLAAITVDETPAYTAALAAYVEDKVIDDTGLQRVIASCDRNEVTNPVSREEAELDTAKWHAYQVLQEWIESGSLNARQVCEWVKNARDKQRQERRSREETREDTALVWDEAEQQKLAVGYELACGIDKDGSLICWNHIWEFHLAPEEGKVRNVVLVADKALIIKTDGTLGYMRFPYVDPPDSSWQRNKDDRYVFTLHLSELSPSIAHSGPFHFLSVEEHKFCALGRDWEGICDRLPESIYAVPPRLPTGLGSVRNMARHVTFSHFACATLADGTGKCWDEKGNLLFEDIGEVLSIVVTQNVCFLRSDYTLVCRNYSEDEVKLQEDPGPLRSLATGYFCKGTTSCLVVGATCGIQMSGDVVCWADDGQALEGMAGPAMSIAVGVGKAFALMANGEVKGWNLVSSLGLNDRTLVAPSSLRMKAQ